MSRQDIMQYIFEVFDPSLPRLGPGNSESTRRALAIVLPTLFHEKGVGSLRILDMGCGNGAQTLELAKHVDGIITAVDNYQPFLDELRRRADKEGVSDKIMPCMADMNNLELEKGTFDIVWAEGSLYNAGFGRGLELCREHLVPGGFLAVSELSWLRPDPSPECRDFFAEAYPAMVDIDTNLATISDKGFEVLGCFPLPEAAWWEPYYKPLENRLAVLQKRHIDDSEWMRVIQSFRHEIDMFRRDSYYFGNVFYVMQRK